MNDLETRVRHALHEDPATPGADALIDDVRRDARRRRARRTTGLVAAAALVLAAAGGGLAWRHRQIHAADHSQVPDHLSGALAVSVSASGTVFKVVGNQGCTLPCSTIWKQTGGGWTRLATLHESSEGARLWGPVLALEMAPNGRDGWAWGSHLWSTHDGGTTWSRVTSLPGTSNPTYTNLDLVPGATYTYAAVEHDRQRQLWRSPTGADNWTQVSFPPHAEGNIAAVLPDSRVALQVWEAPGFNDDMRRIRRHGKVVRLIEQYEVGDGTGPWHRVQVPCVTVPEPTPTTRAILCGPGGRTEGAGGIIGPKTTDGTPRYRDVGIPIGVVGTDAHDPVGHMLQLHVTTDGTFLVSTQGATRLPLHVEGLSKMGGHASQGSHAVFIDGNHRIYATDDGGRHWHELP